MPVSFMALLGAAGAVATIVEALILRDTPSGWASTMTVLLLVGGVQSMILGVLGEYVGRTFLSANGKPQGTVRSIERNAAAERRRSVTFYWVTLFAAIATSMAGQALLKAGAGAASFITQLFDWRTLLGLVPVWRRGGALHRGAAPHSDVARPALHRDLLCRRGADRALRVRRGAGCCADRGDRVDLRRRGVTGLRLRRLADRTFPADRSALAVRRRRAR